MATAASWLGKAWSSRTTRQVCGWRSATRGRSASGASGRSISSSRSRASQASNSRQRTCGHSTTPPATRRHPPRSGRTPMCGSSGWRPSAAVRRRTSGGKRSSRRRTRWTRRASSRTASFPTCVGAGTARGARSTTTRPRTKSPTVSPLTTCRTTRPQSAYWREAKKRFSRTTSLPPSWTSRWRGPRGDGASSRTPNLCRASPPSPKRTATGRKPRPHSTRRGASSSSLWSTRAACAATGTTSCSYRNSATVVRRCCRRGSLAPHCGPTSRSAATRSRHWWAQTRPAPPTSTRVSLIPSVTPLSPLTRPTCCSRRAVRLATPGSVWSSARSSTPTSSRAVRLCALSSARRRPRSSACAMRSGC